MSDYKFPKGEIPITDLADKNGNVIFVITEHKIRGLYYLYDVSKGVAIKLGKGESPPELERKFNTAEKMGCKI